MPKIYLEKEDGYWWTLAEDGTPILVEHRYRDWIIDYICGRIGRKPKLIRVSAIDMESPLNEEGWAIELTEEEFKCL